MSITTHTTVGQVISQAEKWMVEDTLENHGFAPHYGVTFVTDTSQLFFGR